MRKALVKSAAGRLSGRRSTAKKLTFAVLVLGAVAAANLSRAMATALLANGIVMLHSSVGGP
jgi:hypothetical protein